MIARVPDAAFKYEDRILAFMDILGWKDLIGRSLRDGMALTQIGSTVGKLRAFNSLMAETTRAMHDFGDHDQVVEVSLFSDTVVLSCQGNKPALHYMMQRLNRFRLSLLKRGIYTRGGLVRGTVYHRDGMVVGPGLVEAHWLESNIARFPRIVVSDGLCADLDSIAMVTAAGNRQKWYLSDRDGLNVLNPFVGLGDSRLDEIKPIAGCLKRVEKDLKTHRGDAAIRSQLGWLVGHIRDVQALYEDESVPRKTPTRTKRRAAAVPRRAF